MLGEAATFQTQPQETVVDSARKELAALRILRICIAKTGTSTPVANIQSRDYFQFLKLRLTAWIEFDMVNKQWIALKETDKDKARRLLARRKAELAVINMTDSDFVAHFYNIDQIPLPDENLKLYIAYLLAERAKLKAESHIIPEEIIDSDLLGLVHDHRRIRADIASILS